MAINVSVQFTASYIIGHSMETSTELHGAPPWRPPRTRRVPDNVGGPQFNSELLPDIILLTQCYYHIGEPV